MTFRVPLNISQCNAQVSKILLIGVMFLLVVGFPLFIVVHAVDTGQANALQKSDGSLVEYKITLTNTGKGTAFQVQLHQEYPKGAVFVDSSVAPIKGTTFFSLGDITPGSSAVLRISVASDSLVSKNFEGDNASISYKSFPDSPPKISAVSTFSVKPMNDAAKTNEESTSTNQKDNNILPPKIPEIVPESAVPDLPRTDIMLGKGGDPLSFERVKNRPELACGVSRNAGIVRVLSSPSIIPAPQGFETIVPPFTLSCEKGEVDVSMSVPSGFTSIRTMRISGEKNAEVKNVESADLVCGAQSLTNFTAESLRRKVMYLNVTELPPISTKSTEITAEKNSLALAAHKIHVLDSKRDFVLEAGSVSRGVPLPQNPSLNIIGAPLQVLIKNNSAIPAGEGVSVEVDFAFAESQLLDKSSLAVFRLNGSVWEYQGGIANDSAVVANVSLHITQPTILALMGTYCAGCVQSELVKKFDGGSRIAVVLVHGLTSRASKWQYLLDEFKYTHQPEQVFFFNYPVTKKTEENARALIDLLEKKQDRFDAVYFVGHSLGGFVVESGLNQAFIANKKNPAAYTFLEKVRKVLILGAPHEGSPSAEAYLNLFSFFANQQDVIPVVNANTEVVREVTKGKVFAKVPGIDYVVMAGTKPYEFNAGLFKASTNELLAEENDGITNVSGARKIGSSELRDFCSNYYEINVTHTQLDDDTLARKVITYVLASDIAAKKVFSQPLLGLTKYVQIAIQNCSSSDVYMLIGKSVAKDASPSVLGCNCGNKVCGLDENELSCPSDCGKTSVSEEARRIKTLTVGILVLLSVCFGVLSFYACRNQKWILLACCAILLLFFIAMLILILV